MGCSKPMASTGLWLRWVTGHALISINDLLGGAMISHLERNIDGVEPDDLGETTRAFFATAPIALLQDTVPPIAYGGCLNGCCND